MTLNVRMKQPKVPPAFPHWKDDEQDGRYFLKYIHAPSTNKANVVAQRYVSRIPVFLAIG